MLELENITKVYNTASGPIQVLKGINLFVARGEFVSVMGPSGSGKSTLAAILGCLSPPTGGSFVLDGQPVTKMSPDALAHFRNQKIGFIFQDFNLLEGLSALDNVALPLLYAGYGRGERLKRAAAALEKVNLADRMYYTPKQLSGGQKQRVAVARALVNNPALIFADEPTGALDAKNTTEVMELLQSLNVAGHTIVQVTHAPEDAQYSKRIVTMMDGQIIKDDFVEDFAIGTPRFNDKDRPGPASSLWRVAGALRPDDAEGMRAMKRLFKRTQDTHGLIAAAKVLVHYKNPDLSAVMLKLFRHPHWAVRAEIVRACDPSTNDQAIGYLAKSLEDESSWVRFLALSQVRRLDVTLQQVVGKDAILRCVDDPDDRVRSVAASVMGSWHDAQFIPRLIKIATSDVNSRVRSNSVEILAQHLGLGADAELIATFRMCTTAAHHRLASTAAVLLFPHDQVAADAALRRLRESENFMDRAAAAWAMGMVPEGPQHGPALVDMLKRETEETVIKPLTVALTRTARKGFSFRAQVDQMVGREVRVEDQPVALDTAS